MSDPVFALHKAIFAALSGDGDLAAAGLSIFDHVTAEAAAPYVSLRPGTVRDWSSKSFGGFEITYFVHVWSDAPGRREAHQAMALVRVALTQPLALDAATLVLMDHEFSDLRDDASGLLHGVMRFRALVQAD